MLTEGLAKVRRLIGGLLAIAAALSLLALLGGFLGGLHPVGDSLAVFRPQLALIAGVMGGLLLIARSRALAALTLAVAVGAGVTLGTAAYGPQASAGYSLYQKNMSFRNPDWSAVAADIRDVQPDFVTLQEVSTRNRPMLGDLKGSYPAAQYCDFATVGGTAVLSRFAAVPGSERCTPGLSAVKVVTPDGELWLISIHLHWPWPYGQAEHVAELRKVLSDMPGPKIIAGDFNMVPWSNVLEGLRSNAGGVWEGPTHNTLRLLRGLISIPIDHVLTPLGGNAEVRPQLGSDHEGLLVRFPLSRP